MIYEVVFDKKAARDIRELPKEFQRQIVLKIELLCDDLHGDVKRLTNFTPEYRLRVGDYRVLFEIEDNTIVIYRIKHRKESY